MESGGVATAYQDAPRRCAALTAKGRPCLGWSMHGSAYCFQHNPEIEDERTEARSRGGSARHGRRILQVGADDWTTSVDLDATVMLQRAQDVAMGMEPSLSMARTLGYLAGVLVQVRKVDEMEDRIIALEKAAGVTK
jgi:hypothetical protein